MTPVGITEATIRQLASDESFRRGESYYADGAVASAIQRGDALTAAVWGSEPKPYRVVVRLDRGGVANADCDCPYDWGGWCKHIVAALLFTIRKPEQVQERPPIEVLLAGLSPEQLRALLLGLARRDPDLVEAVETEAAQLEVSPAAPAAASTSGSEAAAPPAPPPPRPVPLDDKPFRRAVQAALHSADRLSGSEAYYAVSGIVGEVGSVLDKARGFIQAGDARSALVVLEAITDELKEAWETLDDSDGEVADFFGELGEVWTEAILGADLEPGERAAWRDKLDQWQSDVGEYGVDDCFTAALAAAKQGWDYPPLVRILRGEPGAPTAASPADEAEGGEEDEKGDEREEDDFEQDQEDLEALFDPDLIAVRLDVLDRQGRNEEFLQLADAAGATTRYATMLVKLGRLAEAAEYSLRQVSTPREALIVAKALRDANQLGPALGVAERGLTLGSLEVSTPGRHPGVASSLDRGRGELAAWTRDLAASLGEGELALAAALVAFREDPSLAAYLRVQELSGPGWPRHRAELLDYLRRSQGYSVGGHVDVFLHEGLIADAIAAVERSYDKALVQRVMDAGMGSHPDWVIQTARRRAEPIMDEGRAGHYDEAVGWLAKGQVASERADRTAEWRAYLDGLTARHARKYKLVPMLQALRQKR
jgi:uncharacterized Zn finger protein